MTKRELLAMALKFTGIVYSLHSFCFFLGTLRQWPGNNLSNLDINGIWAINITSTLADILPSLAMIAWGDILSRWLVHHDASVLPLHAQGWEKSLLETIVKFLGLLYLLWGLPKLLTDVLRKINHWNIVVNEYPRFSIADTIHIRTILTGIALIALSNFLVTYGYAGSKANATLNSETLKG